MKKAIVTGITGQDGAYLAKFLINKDRKILIVSNKEMHDKLKNIIENKKFIKKIITFEKLDSVDYQDKYINFDEFTAYFLSL